MGENLKKLRFVEPDISIPLLKETPEKITSKLDMDPDFIGIPQKKFS
jgi:hypothetical protein